MLLIGYYYHHSKENQNFRQLKHWSKFWDFATSKTAFLSRKHVSTVPANTMSQSSRNHRLRCFCNCIFNWHSPWKQPERSRIWPIKTTPTLCPLSIVSKKEQWQGSKNTNATWNTTIQLQGDRFHLKTNTNG